VKDSPRHTIVVKPRASWLKGAAVALMLLALLITTPFGDVLSNAPLAIGVLFTIMVITFGGAVVAMAAWLLFGSQAIVRTPATLAREVYLGPIRTSRAVFDAEKIRRVVVRSRMFRIRGKTFARDEIVLNYEGIDRVLIDGLEHRQARELPAGILGSFPR
jgi:hypothetical protein